MRDAFLMLGAVVSALTLAVVSFRAGVRVGFRQGRVDTLDQMRTELDTTIATWEQSKGDAVARYAELPGLYVVRRMLGGTHV